MQKRHEEGVAQLETRLTDQRLRYETEIAQRQAEISQMQETSQQTVSEIRKLAEQEKQDLLAKIRFIFLSNHCFDRIRYVIDRRCRSLTLSRPS